MTSLELIFTAFARISAAAFFAFALVSLQEKHLNAAHACCVGISLPICRVWQDRLDPHSRHPQPGLTGPRPHRRQLQRDRPTCG